MANDFEEIIEKMKKKASDQAAEDMSSAIVRHIEDTFNNDSDYENFTKRDLKYLEQQTALRLIRKLISKYITNKEEETENEN